MSGATQAIIYCADSENGDNIATVSHEDHEKLTFFDANEMPAGSVIIVE